MSTIDDFYQLGQDLWAFADNPERFLGVFTRPRLDDTLRATDKVFTPRWEITRIRHLRSARSTDYKWQEQEGYREAISLEHTLRVTSDAAGCVSSFVLGCLISADRAYKITYGMHLYMARVVEFSRPHASGANSGLGKVLTEDQELPELEEVLQCIPSEMTQNSYRGLASV